ncbi:MAG: replicative DNA helicase [Rhodospirillales bacterium]|jgi:replicative DNA helicase|nr:replicative DNA helicase [Rhodospirillales bacterium]MBT4007531.1 replicative DNA helicase [Rhodospirillales bacterium]MBT5077188.1 replicative DNA helicase [Rhodospirillales bacterium]MBT5113245.1 replicative DNA helicase [Rhodospirillales bacterium]MBT5671878.1 replicative DNA helicase [Rhodospirillales bacterium]
MVDLTPEQNVTPLRGNGPHDTYVDVPDLPHNFEAEQALLGAILINNEAHTRVSEFLLGEHFYDPVHGRIYDACAKLIERHQVANPVTLQSLFEGDEALSDAGGAKYLGRLAATAVTVINAGDYGRTLFDLHLRRKLIELSGEIRTEAASPDLDTSAIRQIETTEQHLFDLATTGEYEGGFRSFTDVLTTTIEMAEAAYKRDGKLTGTTTGFTDMDKLLGGLQPSDLVILAGRPSMGKTALATNIAYNAAKACRMVVNEQGQKTVADGAVVGFFSLEMSSEQLATRILAEASGISSDRIRKGELSNKEFQKVVEANQELARIPFFIDDTPALSIGQLRTRARRLKRQHGLSMIVVDYLQLLRATLDRSSENRVQEVSEITRGLKALAKELNVPVVALSQLSRAVEQREDKRPQLSDLRESGSIEQDADVVMFLYREEYYLSRLEPEMGTEDHEKWQMRMEESHNLAEAIVGKQRHGPTGTIKMVFTGELTRFSDYIPPDRLPDQNVPF